MPVGPSVNAWIYLNEDEPPNTNYNDPTSCFQTLIQYGVYQNVDILSICWCNTVLSPDGTSYTIELESKTHPGGISNQQYMEWVITAARNANPNIKILIMMGMGADEISQIFSNDQSQWPAEAAAFASNMVSYLQANDLDGFDVDWESPLSDMQSTEQFQYFFTAIHAAFQQQTGKTYYLGLSPAAVGPSFDGTTVNDCFDFVNLQLYSGFTSPQEFTNAGVNLPLLAYGAKFESIGNGDLTPFQNAQNAYDGTNSAGFGGYTLGPNGDGNPPYTVIINWRLNSGDFMYEQSQQIILYQLVHGIPGPAFDDSPIIQLAGQSSQTPTISQIVVRSGEVLDAIQVTSTGQWSTDNQVIQLPPYSLPQHGGNGGSSTTVVIPSGDALATVSGYTADWYGWNCVAQITLSTRNGKTFGPFGTMGGASGQTPFSYSAPSGQSIIAFSGTTETVPMAGGGSSEIVTSLNVTFG
jgi:hypothetical protein